MTTGVGSSDRAFWNILARLRQRLPVAFRRTHQMSPEVARLQSALDMHELGVQLYRQRMHRDHPHAGPADIDQMVRTWLAEPSRSGRLRLLSRERDHGVG